MRKHFSRGARIGTTLRLAVVAAAVGLLFAIQPAVALSAPETTITSAPSGYVQDVSNEVTFISDDPAATFQCQIGAEGAFQPCSSPFTVTTISAYEEFKFFVRAIGATSLDLTPAQATWYYLPPIAPPIVKYTAPSPTVRRMKLKNFKTIAGTAFSTSEVTEVRVMLRLFVKGEEKDRDILGNRVCTHIDMKTGRRIKRDCFDRPYARATGQEDWIYKLPKRLRRALKPGKYTIEARGFNGMGSIEKKLRVIRLTR